MKATLDDYVASVKRAERVGYDLLELHAAHGYLLHQFLSPLSNQRTDEYGGSLEKRMRYPLEVFAAIRAVWPNDKPLGIRVSAVDWVEGGTTIEDTIKFAQELKALGCDYMDVSTGELDSRQKIPFAPNFNVPFAERSGRQAGMPTMSVGLITDAARPKRSLRPARPIWSPWRAARCTTRASLGMPPRNLAPRRNMRRAPCRAIRRCAPGCSPTGPSRPEGT